MRGRTMKAVATGLSTKIGSHHDLGAAVDYRNDLI